MATAVGTAREATPVSRVTLGVRDGRLAMVEHATGAMISTAYRLVFIHSPKTGGKRRGHRRTAPDVADLCFQLAILRW